MLHLLRPARAECEMADACSQLDYPATTLQQRVAQLEQQLAAQRRTNELLLKRVAKSVDIEGGAFSLHEQNSQLQESVRERNRELEEANRHLRQEVAERRMIEQALRISEERYRFLMEESQQPLIVLKDFTVVYGNPAAARLLGYESAARLQEVDFDTLLPIQDRAQQRSVLEQRISGAEPERQYEARFVRRDGRVVWCEVNATIGDFEGSVAVIASLHDVTERKQAALELARSNSVLRATLESTADGILVVDSNGVVSTFNEKFLELWNLEQLQSVDRLHLDLLAEVSNLLKDPAELLQRTSRIYEQPESNSFDLLEFQDGRVVERFSQPQRVAGQCVGRVWSFRDITERRRAEETKQQLENQLRQAQKMEAIGTLAGGIAHDFNNIIYAIQGYAELVQESLPAGSQSWQDQQEVLVASKRAADLVRQILAFSRRSSAEAVPVNVGDTAREVLRLMRATLPATIEVTYERRCDNALVLADPTQIHQILMNLCTNAGHALGQQPGLLEVSLRTEVITPTGQKDGEGKAGNYVVLSVRDNGCGMPQEVLDRIFDPFFTTKDVGVGTGLGLSTVHGIVTGMGGEIRVQSEAGVGTTFEVFFPQSAACIVQSESAAQDNVSGSERILLVEDEEPLARMCAEALRRLGYVVEPFVSSMQALRRFQESPTSFDLVVTDQSMPQMTGSTMAAVMLALRPELPIILCTGYSESVTPESAREMGMFALLEKPLAMRDLALTIREALAGRTVAAG
jgi:PAS domain S-box-containing protein